MTTRDRYSHGHHESVLRSHLWRTAENSAGFLLPHLLPDHRVLDVGCGPGNITIDLARRVPAGHVTGVDVAAAAIDLATHHTPREGVENVDFVVGDGYHLDFADGSFDVAYAHQVLQHTSDPVAVLKDVRRVLRANGLLAVREADYGAFTWAPDDERLTKWMDLYQRLTRTNRTEPNAGRYLHIWVRQAGFTIEQVSSSNWTYQTPAERAWWGGLWADRVRESEFARQSLEYGLATRDELEEIAQAFLDWAGNVDGMFMVPSNEVLARR
ncbi:MAG TPA: methyltransferase domain-containing protein [Acidimicrobiales bacterium]|nr:methyltransferase domain-containing protein [Acidimicrobiales bacterium]